MRLLNLLLAALLGLALLAPAALAQDSPGAPPNGDDGVAGEVIVRGDGGMIGVGAERGLADTGIEVTTGALLVGALVLAGGALLLVTRRRPTSS